MPSQNVFKSLYFSVNSGKGGERLDHKREYRILFSERLSFLIKRNGLTNVQLARAIQVSPALITKYTKGKASPSYENFIMIADYFNVSLDYLRGKDNY